VTFPHGNLSPPALATTFRNWNTVATIAAMLDDEPPDRASPA